MCKSKKKLLRSQQKFKSKRHNVFTEKVNKIALSFNDDKRLQSFYKVKSYPINLLCSKNTFHYLCYHMAFHLCDFPASIILPPISAPSSPVTTSPPHT